MVDFFFLNEEKAVIMKSSEDKETRRKRLNPKKTAVCVFVYLKAQQINKKNKMPLHIFPFGVTCRE